MLTYPVVDPVCYSSRGGDCRHRGASLSRCLSFAKTRAPPERVWGKDGVSGTLIERGINLRYEGSASPNSRARRKFQRSEAMTERARGSSRNVGHEQPIRHTLLEVPDHGRLGSRDRDCECFAGRRLELNDLKAKGPSRLCRPFRRSSAADATSREGHHQQRSDREVRHQRWGRGHWRHWGSPNSCQSQSSNCCSRQA
jgi:hypothetical protein